MRRISILFICGSLFLSCKPVSKSIEETFNSRGTSGYQKDQEKVSKKSGDSSAILDFGSKGTTSTTTETHTVTHTEQHTAGEKSGFLNNTDKLMSAEVALKQLPQYAGKEIFLYLFLSFYEDGTINAMLQHPENSRYVDSYEYRDGKWSAPIPKQLSVKDDIQRSLVSLNKINFASVAQVNKIYREKASRIEGAKPLTNIYITIVNNVIDWYPMNIEGSRGRYAIRFNTDGTLKSFKQD